MRFVYLVKRIEQWEPSVVLFAFESEALAKMSCDALNAAADEDDIGSYIVNRMEVLSRLPNDDRTDLSSQP